MVTKETTGEVAGRVNKNILASILCYVKGPWAYFTTQPLSEQWGDDWNDIPYEYNAGRPYKYRADCVEEGKQPWAIYQVAWEGPFDEPRERFSSYSASPFSVEAINAGAIAWLQTEAWRKELIVIPAGTSLQIFINLIQMAGGEVYIAVSDLSKETNDG